MAGEELRPEKKPEKKRKNLSLGLTLLVAASTVKGECEFVSPLAFDNMQSSFSRRLMFGFIATLILSFAVACNHGTADPPRPNRDFDSDPRTAYLGTWEVEEECSSGFSDEYRIIIREASNVAGDAFVDVYNLYNVGDTFRGEVSANGRLTIVGGKVGAQCYNEFRSHNSLYAGSGSLNHSGEQLTITFSIDPCNSLNYNRSFNCSVVGYK